MERSVWEAKAREWGVDAVYFVAPRKWRYKGSETARKLEGDPFSHLPGTTCMIALLKAYRPFRARKDGGPDLSAFYLASHALYGIGRKLEAWSAEEGLAVVMAELPAKGMLAQSGIARIGRNSLASTDELGSRFTVRWMLTDAFAPDAVRVNAGEDPCASCDRCAKACPAQAIGDELDPTRCIRWYMNGQAMPDWVKEKMSGLTGCDICQKVCPKNAAIEAVETPEDLASLFTFERLIDLDGADKKRFADRLGKNMITQGRLTAQALVLAAKRGNGTFAGAARRLLEEGSDCERDAAAWYIASMES